MASPHCLSQWPIFSLLEHDFVQGIRLACVFGSAGQEAIIVTHEGDVYGLGSNGYSCLGLGNSKSSLLPCRLDQLCKRGPLYTNTWFIISFSRYKCVSV